MKITLVNHSDTLGGASVVTFRLMEALRTLGIDARMLVAKKMSDSPFVEQAASSLRTKLPFLKEHLQIFTHNGFSRKDLFKASIATAGLPLSRHPLITDADAVILNWVNQGMLSLDEIERIASEKPTLWTMHDMWNFTGICHHAGTCDKYLTHCHDCPLLNSDASPCDLSFKTFNRKQGVYSNTSIKFIAVSSWLAAHAHDSKLLGKCRVETIHNAIRLDRFGAPPEYSRAELGLPENKKLIVFCAARIDDPIKCFPLAIEAFNELASTHGDKACAVLVGDIRNPDALNSLKLHHVFLGPVHSPTKMQSIMSHASVVLSTSSYESLPTILIEGQAAGAIPVGFIHDGRADIIIDGKSGYAIRPADFYKNQEKCETASCRLEELAKCKIAATAETLRKAIDNPISNENLALSASRFSYDSIARQYLKLIGKA